MANTTGKKFGGRKKGAPNKVTTDTRKAYQDFVEGNIENLNLWMSELSEPDKKLDFMLKFSEYFIPRLARTELTGKDGKDLPQPILGNVHNNYGNTEGSLDVKKD